MPKDNERIFIITVGLVISVLGGVYLYTQNTGINACLNQGAINAGYDSWKHIVEVKGDPKSSIDRRVRANMRSNMIFGDCSAD